MAHWKKFMDKELLGAWDLEGRDVTVTIDLKAGPERATVWTNDLTHAYVHENSAYSS